MRFILTLILLFFSFSAIAQDTIRSTSAAYIPIKSYKALGYNITQNDSLNFKFVKGDTLVKMPKGFERSQLVKGIAVPFEPQDSTFLEVYKNVVFANQRSYTKNAPTLKIWQDDIKIFFEPTVPGKHQKLLMEFTERISADIDSLNIKKVKKRENANFHIYYLNQDSDIDYDLRMESKKEGFYISWNGKQQLYEAYLKIDTRLFSNQESVIESLKVNFFQALGYFYFSEKVPAPGFLSLTSSEKKLTDLDLKILKYHYSFGICKGTKLNEFEATHENYRNMIKENPNSELTIIHPYEYFN